MGGADVIVGPIVESGGDGDKLPGQPWQPPPPPPPDGESPPGDGGHRK